MLLLVVALIAAGCGSSGGSGSTSASATNAETTSAPTSPQTIAVPELDRLGRQEPLAIASLPSPSTTTTFDRRFVTAVFNDAQRVWRLAFEAAHLPYHRARLMLFWSKVESGCGHHEDSGPFYCPAGDVVYLDERFFTALLRRHGVGVAAQAYIIGHEFGHHVQRLLGIGSRVEAANKVDPGGENARSVKYELEADCLAGVWARSAYPRSERSVSDLYEALKTADVIGDDYLAKAAGNVVDSAMWKHGSSQQRQYWLRTGFKDGRSSACNTFTSG